MCYDVTRADSFASLDQWLQEMEVYCPGGGREVSIAYRSHIPPAHAARPAYEPLVRSRAAHARRPHRTCLGGWGRCRW